VPGVRPTTLYRQFANKEALVGEVLCVFFGRLIELPDAAEQAPPPRSVDVFLETVGYEQAGGQRAQRTAEANE